MRSRPPSPCGQGGQSLIALAALLPLLLLPLTLYTVEAALLAARQARLSGAVIQAAEDAAQEIDADSYRREGVVRSAPARIPVAAAASLFVSDPEAVLDSARVGPDGLVTVSAREPVPLQVGFIWPGARVVLSARSRARIRSGYDPTGSISPSSLHL